MANTSWLTEFPEMENATLIALRKSLDGAYREFSRTYGEAIENFFDPLLYFLVWFEKLLLNTPWFVVLATLVLLTYGASRSVKLCIGVTVAFLLIGYFGMWENTMQTLSIITVATILSVALGLPIGIWMARSNRAQNIITPILDVMQTMPAFVYLIPVVMLLGIGKVPGIIAVLIYAIPPVIRLTNLGIRLVDRDVLEAATAFGASPMQRLLNVQLPLALPNIMAGINQTIMMALSMVVIAALIGAGGLGNPVVQGLNTLEIGLATIGGLAIVLLAMVLDRITQGIGKRKA